MQSTNQKQEWPVAAMFANRWGRNEQSLQRTFHKCFLPSFASFGKVVSEENIFRNRPIRKKNCLWWPCFLTNQDEMSNLYGGPSIHAFYQISVHLGKWFQRRRFFRNQHIRKKNGLWWPCLLMDWNYMSNFYRTFQGCFLPSFDSFGQVVSEEKIFFLNQAIRNKNGLWRTCLLKENSMVLTSLRENLNDSKQEF